MKIRSNERIKSNPIYRVMQSVPKCESKINYIFENNAHLTFHRGTGISIAKEVCARFFRIYKVPAYRGSDIVSKICHKFSCQSLAYSELYRNAYSGIGLINVDKNGNLKAIKCSLVCNLRDDFLNKKSKKLPVGIELDILVLSKETEFLSKLSKTRLIQLRNNNG